jgi:hypothetical protein
MSPFVLDTDVFSFLFKNDSRAAGYLPHLRDRQWVISFMTEAELEQWALLAGWQPKRVEWLRVFLSKMVIVPSSRDLVVRVSFEEGKGRVEVTVYRMQTPGLRPSSRAIALTHVAANPQGAAQGTGTAYETAVSQDTRLAARLAAAIGKRIGRAVVK